MFQVFWITVFIMLVTAGVRNPCSSVFHIVFSCLITCKSSFDHGAGLPIVMASATCKCLQSSLTRCKSRSFGFIIH
jgi:hypothetical protein